MEKYKKILDFIRDVYSDQEGFIPLHAPIFSGNEKKYLNECIDSSFVSSVGKFVDKFEEMMAEYTRSKKAVACVNGTNALYLALILSGVSRNDEVITQPLTFIATCNAISYIGAIPVFVDVDLSTLGMSPDSLLTFLKENTLRRFNESLNKHECFNKNTGRRIKACVPMHTFGHPCRIDEILEICTEYNIEVVEDAAESLGSFYKEKHTGTIAKIGALSFNGNKTITTGGGGMLLFQDEELAKHAKHLTTQAKIPHPWEFSHDFIGYNYRMPNINAALGCAQLEQLPDFLASKRKIAQQYEAFFSENKNLNVSYFIEPSNAKSNYWLNVIVFENKVERDAFLKFSNENGVMTRPAWKLMNELTMFLDSPNSSLNNAQKLSDCIVNIPSSSII